jgi:hypothetical protein
MWEVCGTGGRSGLEFHSILLRKALDLRNFLRRCATSSGFACVAVAFHMVADSERQRL